LRKLPAENDTIPYNVLEDEDIDSYKIENKGKKEINLTGYGELKPISDVGGEPIPLYNEALSVIIKELNEAFGTDFTDDDKLFLVGIKNHLMENESLKNKIKSNSKQKVKVVFDNYFNEEMKTLLNNNIEFYKRIVDNEKLKNQLKSLLFDSVYNAFIKETKKKS